MSVHSLTAASSSSAGTTLLTRPISSASCPLYWRLRYQISRAFLSPTWRARKAVPQPASTEPTLGPNWPSFAVSALIDRSQSVQNTLPPPIATPLLRPSPGLGQRVTTPLGEREFYSVKIQWFPR